MPSVDRVVRAVGRSAVASHDILVVLAREELADLRAGSVAVNLDDVVRRVESRVEAMSRPRLSPIINGTGVILHTNLGRAPVSRETALAMAEAASSYVSLEIEPETNRRGGRMREISEAMRLLCGAERTLVVNNNAAALLLTLAALASGREVIVARGESVEIGGGFRVPDVVAQGGCRLVDVGTTNRTRPADYAQAIGSNTGAILKVHPSNFVIDGFTAEATVKELAVVARERGVPFVHDIGSGTLIDPTLFGLRSEPTFHGSIEVGTDIVTASGDKLMGGPQAGIICGRGDLVDTIAAHPLARALRADKVTLAGVAATLGHYLAGNAIEKVPVWRMISVSVDELRERATSLAVRTGWDVSEMRSTVGGGSLPGEEIPSVGIAWSTNVERVAARLRIGEPRVFGRVNDGFLLIDLRTVAREQDEALGEAIERATASSGA